MSNERTSLLLIAASLTAGLVIVLAQTLVPYFGTAGLDMRSVFRGFGILTTLASMVRIVGLVGLATTRPKVAVLAIVTVLAMVFSYALPFVVMSHLGGVLQIALANIVVSIVIHTLTWVTLHGVAKERRRNTRSLDAVFFGGLMLHVLAVLFVGTHSLWLPLVGLSWLGTLAALIESSALLATTVSLAQDA